MATRQYRRSMRLTVVDRNGEGRSWSSLPDRVGPRIVASTKRDDASEPNIVKVDIYNLSEDSRGFIQSEGSTMRIEAGYDGDLRILATADISRAFSEYAKPQWITKLEGEDGGSSFRTSQIHASWPPNTSARTVFDALAQALGLPLGAVPDLSDRAFKRGVVASGFVRAELETICSTLSLTWSIQNGALEVVEAGAATTENAVVVAPRTGLIGSPSLLNAKQGQGGSGGVKFRTRLNPLLTPRRGVRLESLLLTGTYIVTKVSHKCDSWAGGDYTTECEAEDFGGDTTQQ